MYKSLLICLVFVGVAQAEIVKPSLFVAPQTQSFLSPSQNIAQKFLDANSKLVNLPEKGRYLLWLSDALFSTEDSKEVVRGNGESRSILYNIGNYIKSFNSNKSYIIFYNDVGRIPDSDQWKKIQDDFKPLNALFDQEYTLTETSSFGGFSSVPNIAGLYFMDGQKVQYRFLTNNVNAWDVQAVLPLIVAASRDFLLGRDPKNFAASVMQPGAVFPKSLWNTGKPALFFRISGNELDVPKEPLLFDVTRRSDGSESSKKVGNPPRQAELRFVLDNLPALTRSSGVQLVAVTINTKRLEELRKAFPAWTFVGLDTPEKRLAWYNVGTLLVDAQGKVRLPFIIFPSTSKNTAVLENALEAVKP